MIVLAVALAIGATWLLVGPPPEARARRLLGAASPPRRRGSDSALLTRAAGIVAGFGAWFLVGGVAGAVLGVACVVAVPRLTRGMESGATRRRREQLERDAPLLADLLAATVASGAPMRAALEAVSRALGDPTVSSVRPVLVALDLGAEPALAWLAAAHVPAFGPVVDAVVRSARSGAPLAIVLSRIAEDMRRDRQTSVEVAARSAGVRAVAPLAACFLPAFLLVGVVPVVASLAGALLG